MDQKSQNETAAPAEETVRVYNRGTRSFTHGKHVAHKGAFSNVPASVAETWFRLFPDEVVASEVATKQIGGANAEAADLRVKLEAANKRIAELEELLEVATDPKSKSKGKGKDKDLV